MALAGLPLGALARRRMPADCEVGVDCRIVWKKQHHFWALGKVPAEMLVSRKRVMASTDGVWVPLWVKLCACTPWRGKSLECGDGCLRALIAK